MKRTSVITFLIIAGLTITAVLVFGNHEKETPSEVAPAAALTVSETAVTEIPWRDIIKATGSITAWQEAIIGAEVSGQKLVAVMADVGDAVKAGQVLAKYNTEMLNAEYAELKANWVAAESNRKRALSLKGSGAMSAQAIENFINLAAVAKAQMDAKELQLKYAEVIAPDDGVISSRTATLGAVSNAGDELFRLIRQNRLEWRGELTAAQAIRVSPGQAVSLNLPNGNKVDGTIRQIAPSFSSETRLTTVFVDIKGNSNAQAGMYTEGQITLGEKISLTVPAKSVVIRDGRNYVFVLLNRDTSVSVSQREVQVGQIHDNDAQILSGISKDDRIVFQGAGFLNDGDIVRIAPSTGGAE